MNDELVNVTLSLDQFQDEATGWVYSCFGIKTTEDVRERAFRFLEEAIELFQAPGLQRADALHLVDYVFSRPKGAIVDEIGGSLITLAALTSASHQQLNKVGVHILGRCRQQNDEISKKHSTKPSTIRAV